MIILKNAKVEADDKSLELDFDNAHVVITGTSPKAIASISTRDEKGKLSRRDRLVDAEVKAHKKGGYTVIGTSVFIRDTVGASDHQVALRIGPGKRCTNC